MGYGFTYSLLHGHVRRNESTLPLYQSTHSIVPSLPACTGNTLYLTTSAATIRKEKIALVSRGAKAFGF
jgi:hypothetical protein